MIIKASFLKSLSKFSEDESLSLSAVAFLGRSNVGKSSLINALCRQKNLAKSSATPGKTRLINLFEVEFKNQWQDKAENANLNKNENLKANLKQSLNLQENSNLKQSLNSQENLTLKQDLSSNLNSHSSADFSSLDTNFKLIFVDLPGFGYAKVSKTLKKEWDKNLHEYLQKESAIRLFVHLIDARHSDLSIDKEIKDYLKELLSPAQELLQVFTKLDKLNQSQKALLKKNFPKALFVSSAQNKGLDTLEKELVIKSFHLLNSTLQNRGAGREGSNSKANLSSNLNENSSLNLSVNSNTNSNLSSNTNSKTNSSSNKKLNLKANSNSNLNENSKPKSLNLGSNPAKSKENLNPKENSHAL